MTPAAALEAALESQFGDTPPAQIGVALSGGGDSVALTVLLADWTRARGTALTAATVDHGLRPEAAGEAAAAARLCDDLGVPHRTLAWTAGAGSGNLQDRARRARYALLTDWACAAGAAFVALGHTRDDQAETVLLRLARGSGVDGLSAMAPARSSHGITWLRPLLRTGRAELRALLRERGLGWCEDPSNADPRYDRVKARRALAALAPLGLDAGGLGETAARMARARAALEGQADATARETCAIDGGDVLMDVPRLAAAPDETRLRVLSRALAWVASAEYRPRLSALHRAWGAAARGQRHTLAGCLLLVDNGWLRVAREPAAVAGHSTASSALWDGRWHLNGPHVPGLETAALGEAGLRRCPDWRATGRPRQALAASPAVWRDGELVAAPLAGLANGWRAELAHGVESFFACPDSR